MEKIAGIVATDPRNDAGRIHFLLNREDGRKPLSCMSAVDFSGSIPKIGMPITLIGEHKADLVLSSRRTPYFVFSQTENPPLVST